MISSLYIENIAVAKRLDIEFESGFTVITGKTGAGKSIVIDSLLLLCGSKSGRDLIRTGESTAAVSAIFSCDERSARRLAESGYAPDENGEFTITRKLNADGRSSAKINNRSVPLSALKEVSPILLGIQTQSEKNFFADKNSYVLILDSFADNEGILAEYTEYYSSLVSIHGEIAELKKAMAQREMMLEILKYQKKEIDSAKLTSDDEEEKLLKLRTRLKSVEKTAKYSSVVTKSLAFSEKGATAAYLIERAENALSQLTEAVDGADEMIQKLANYRYEIMDIAERVRDSVESEELANPAQKLTQVESRLSTIARLEKKYGTTIAEIKAKREEIAAQIADLEQGDAKLEELEKKLDSVKAKAAGSAEKLSSRRIEEAKKLSDEIVGYLKFLDMPKVRFRVSVVPKRDVTGEYIFTPEGFDDVDFLISVNTGEELQSLGKVSSGGELSRITLAIKTAIADKNDSGTLVFDEIDAGVSGGTSERIGIMLSRLSQNSQVISVTHSPQIASIAFHHLLIEKNETDGRTESSVREIFGEERVGEIARIIGGIEVTEKQTEAAREMLSGSVKE